MSVLQGQRLAIQKAKKDIDIAHVYCNSMDAKYLKNFDAQAVNIIGGLMAENKEKTIRVDYSFETIIENIKDSELHEINKLLLS